MQLLDASIFDSKLWLRLLKCLFAKGSRDGDIHDKCENVMILPHTYRCNLAQRVSYASKHAN
jgi:hypothetical protein